MLSVGRAPQLRIVVVSHYFDSHRGGVEIVAGRLAGELAQLGFSVTWLATNASPAPRGQQRVRAVELAASNVAERTVGIPYPLPSPSAFRRILREIQNADLVLIHDALYLTSIAAFAAARRHGKPVLVVQHIGSVPYKNPLLRGLMKLANRMIARPLLARADQTVFISETTALYFGQTRFRTPPELIFNGVDTQTFSPATGPEEVGEARRRLRLPEQGQVALFVGRFVEKKGLPVLRRLAETRPEIIFAFAGWGPQNPRKWRMPNVRVLDALAGPDLAVLYRASNLLILPSTGEGFPLVVQEALASGLAVVCGRETALADPGAAHLVTGVHVDPDDLPETARGFEKAVAQVLAEGDSPERRKARAALARERYSWSRSAARYAELVVQLTGARRRADRVTLA